ncbi:MAG: cytochrome c [Planctomycetota bacterium]
MRSSGLGLLALLGSVLAGSIGEAVPTERIEDRAIPAVAGDRNGLILELQGRLDGEAATDARWGRVPGLVVKRGEPISPFLDPGIFVAHWRGELDVDSRDRFTFHAVGSGDLTIRIDGEEWISGRMKPGSDLSSDSGRLRKGRHRVDIELKPRLGGRANFRLEWESRKFRREPVPASAWFMPNADNLAADAEGAYRELRSGNQRRRAGSLLVAARCGECHAAPDEYQAVLEPGAPLLAGAGLNRPWLAQWILDPKSLDDETFMPRLLQGPSAEAEALDLAAYLAELGAVETGLAGDAEAGGRLYADLGCFSCHDFSDPREAENWEGHNIPLGLASAKYQLGGIQRFVQDPRRYRPGTAMPDFRLSEEEAADLEAFVRQYATLELEGSSSGDSDRGRALFELRNCSSCHDVEGVDEPAGASSDLAAVLGKIDSEDSCLIGARGSGRPQYAFTKTEVQGFQLLARSGGLAAFGRRVPEEEAQRLLIQRRCIACHSMDGKPSQWSARVGRLEALGLSEHPEPSGEAIDEVLQLRPNLSRIGEKLRQDWTRSFLDEATPIEPGSGVVRTWLRARMPKLPAEEANYLATGLARMHGFEADPEPFVVEDARVANGRKLVSADGGFACTSCHTIGEDGPTTAFEVLGIALEHSAGRLRPEWFQSWMHDPLRYEPASKMPTYASEAGTTGLTEYYGGNAAQQFDAIWHFLHGAQELR